MATPGLALQTSRAGHLCKVLACSRRAGAVLEAAGSVLAQIGATTTNGIDVEEGLAHFHLKAESVENAQEQTAPGEVLVHLLAQLGRHKEALAAYSRYLAQAEPRRLACPPPHELARRSGDYQALAELSLRRGDAVSYAAAKAVSGTTA